MSVYDDVKAIADGKAELENKYSNLQADFRTLLGIARMMYDHIIELDCERRAYNWAEDEIDSHWRTEIGIGSPKKYKHAIVTIETQVIVPDNWEDADIEDLALSHIDGYRGDLGISVEIDSENLSRAESEYHDCVNNIDKFTDGDFE